MVLQPKFPVFWSATLGELNIQHTRSRHQDTLWASISIKRGGEAAVNSPVIGLGDHNNGSFSVPACSTPGVKIDSLLIPVKIGIAVYNLGNNSGTTELISDVAEKIVSYGADDVVPGAGEITDVAYQIIKPILFADCDGPVILKVIGFFDHQLSDGLPRSHPHPPHRIPFSGTDDGYTSPTGCGSNSIYDFSGWITQQGSG